MSPIGKSATTLAGSAIPPYNRETRLVTSWVLFLAGVVAAEGAAHGHRGAPPAVAPEALGPADRLHEGDKGHQHAGDRDETQHQPDDGGQGATAGALRLTFVRPRRSRHAVVYDERMFARAWRTAGGEFSPEGGEVEIPHHPSRHGSRQLPAGVDALAVLRHGAKRWRRLSMVCRGFIRGGNFDDRRVAAWRGPQHQADWHRVGKL